ncbi:MAG TPA: Maf family protein [Terriglobales bacterium]
MQLILASASPRRAELLQNAGIPFIVEPAHVAEQPTEDEQPLQYAQRLARDKALAIFSRHSDDVVLGADTVVVVDEHLLEKPADAKYAARMLRLLSGRAHQVITGVCLIAKDYEQTEAEVTEVRFSTLSENEIANYVETGEPMDKAGAYAIQGMASRWVERLYGCYFNVVGLPVPRVYRMLQSLESKTGIQLLQALSTEKKLEFP